MSVSHRGDEVPGKHSPDHHASDNDAKEQNHDTADESYALGADFKTDGMGGNEVDQQQPANEEATGKGKLNRLGNAEALRHEKPELDQGKVTAEDFVHHSPDAVKTLGERTGEDNKNR